MNERILTLLNEQIWLENRASFYYLNLSVICSINGYKGLSDFFREQSEEERNHMLKICDYILERGGEPQIPANTFLEFEDLTFNVLKIFEDSLFNEKEISSSFYRIINSCREELDYDGENFIQYFIAEQREEESKFRDLIDELKILEKDNSGVGLYQFDMNIRSRD